MLPEKPRIIIKQVTREDGKKQYRWKCLTCRKRGHRRDRYRDARRTGEYHYMTECITIDEADLLRRKPNTRLFNY